MGRLASRECKLYTNLTLLDFADAARCPKRVPKNKLNAINTFHADRATGASITDPGDIEFETTLIPQKSVNSQQDDILYSDYHVDVWFLISEWIAPEDVCRFALICQKTKYVVSTVKFWTHLYRRYYDCKLKMPDCLQPENISRMRGYRTRVIRSLFYTYPKFSTGKIQASPEPEDLIKLKCIGCWYRPEKSGWVLCFKFSRKALMASRDEHCPNEDREVADSWEDIEMSNSSVHGNIPYDREEGNRILVVKTDRFYAPPGFLAPNFILSKIIQPLSQDLRTFKLELTFSDYSGTVMGTVVYDPVKHWKVLRWWDPEYYSYLG